MKKIFLLLFSIFIISCSTTSVKKEAIIDNKRNDKIEDSNKNIEHNKSSENKETETIDINESENSQGTNNEVETNVPTVPDSSREEANLTPIETETNIIEDNEENEESKSKIEETTPKEDSSPEIESDKTTTETTLNADEVSGTTETTENTSDSSINNETKLPNEEENETAVEDKEENIEETTPEEEPRKETEDREEQNEVSDTEINEKTSGSNVDNEEDKEETIEETTPKEEPSTEIASDETRKEVEDIEKPNEEERETIDSNVSDTESREENNGDETSTIINENTSDSSIDNETKPTVENEETTQNDSTETREEPENLEPTLYVDNRSFNFNHTYEYENINELRKQAIKNGIQDYEQEDYVISTYNPNVEEFSEGNETANNEDELKVTIVENSLVNSEEEYINKNFKGINIDSKSKKVNKGVIHSINTIQSFLDSEYKFKVSENQNRDFDYKKINYTTKESYNKQTVGIINLSLGNFKSNEELKNFTKESYYYEDKNFYSDYAELYNLITPYLSSKYYQNKVLKIASIGNSTQSIEDTNWFTSSLNTTYQELSPQMQKIFRSETIMVKNAFSKEIKNILAEKLDRTYGEKTKKLKYVDEYDNEYYEPNFGKNDSKALLLRAMTVSEIGYIKNEQNNDKVAYGSSFSAPRVSRLAYEIKKKFPFLSLQQVKQVILTTAKRDKSGYLSNEVGWGQVDFNKALKGPSDFNAGLIDETKIFRGNYDKIFDEYGNRYFYVNIPENESYIFENDITSGLKGDGFTNKSDILIIKYKEFPESETINYHYRIPKVLDSEKLYYSNVARAGLRKDGAGTLELLGEQNYDTKTQVMNGTLILKNNSKSSYEVNENANFNVISKEKEIKLNKIVNEGKVLLDGKISLDEYLGIKNGVLKITGDSKIKAKKIQGDLQIIDPITDINTVIEAEEISKINLKNLYLKPIVINENKVLILKNIRKKRELNNLTESEKRNLPNYSINEAKFFDEYYNNGINTLSEKSIFNIASYDVVEAKKEIFTTNYSTYISNIFDTNNYIELNNISTNNLEKTYEFKIGTNYLMTVSSDYRNENFSQNMSNNFIKGEILKNGVRANISIGYSKNLLKFKNNDIFNSDIFNISTKLNIGLKYGINLIIGTDISSINTKINRKIMEDNVSTKLNSNLFNFNIGLDKKFSLNHRTNILVGGKYSLDILKIDENIGEKSDYGIKVLNQNIFKNNIHLYLSLDSKITDNIKIKNRIDGKLIIDNENKIKVNLMNQDTELIGKNQDRYFLNLLTELEYKINKYTSIGYNINYTILNKLSTGLSFSIKF